MAVPRRRLGPTRLDPAHTITLEPVREEGERNQLVVTSLFCQERGITTDVDCFRSPSLSALEWPLRNRRDRRRVRPDRAVAAGRQARWPAAGDAVAGSAERAAVSAAHRLPLADAATRVPTQEHGLWLFSPVLEGRHLVQHPDDAAHGGP